MDPLASVPVSTLCDVDKSLPVADPAIRPLTRARLCGPAHTVVAAGEFLSVLYAIGEAAPGDVLVVQAGGAPLAALGELLATEAWRRGLGGIVVDGYVRAIGPGCRRSCRCGRAGPCRWRDDPMWCRAWAGRSSSAACG
jgi:4-hydroxy-4-methyl-2-oxoglutarate aldolase